MLSKVIDYINNRLSTLNVYEKTFGLCDIITDNGRTFPAEYCGSSYNSAADFSNYSGLAYHRLNNDIGIEQTADDSSTGCAVYSKKTYPIRSVFCVKKRDNAYSEELLVSDIEKVISSQNIKSLCDELSMEIVSVSVRGTITDRNKLYKDEFDSENKIGYEYCYFAVLYDIVIEGDLNCQALSTC